MNQEHHPNDNLIASGWKSSKGLTTEGRREKSTSRKVSFRFASYNVLSQAKLKGPQYAYCTAAQVNWHKRKTALLTEILQLGADIICLQEVEHYDDWWRPKLSEVGYDSIFHKRANKHRDGIATFFLRDKFQLFASELIDFNQAGHFLAEKRPSYRLRQDNCASVIALQPWEESDHPSAICVVNTQLVAPKTDDLLLVQRKQLVMLLRSIERFNADFHLPVLMAGSFNMLPHTDLYYMICHGRFPPKRRVPEALKNRPKVEAISSAQVQISWDALPNSRDAPLLGFLVRRRVGGNNSMGFAEPIYFAGADLTCVVICGLASGLTYEFIVAGVSAVGVGEFSQPSLPVKTVKNPALPPENRHLKHPTTLGQYVLESAVETICDWAVQGGTNPACDPDVVQSERRLIPKLEDYTLNLQVNPSRSHMGGKNDTELIHTMSIGSAYSKYENNSEPSATVNSERFRGCSDYIFFTAEHFLPTSIRKLNMPDPLRDFEIDERGRKKAVNFNKDVRKEPFQPDVHDIKPSRWEDEAFLGASAMSSIAEPNPLYIGPWEGVQVENQAARHSWFPNETTPSDHVPLLAEFAFDENYLLTKWS